MPGGLDYQLISIWLDVQNLGGFYDVHDECSVWYGQQRQCLLIDRHSQRAEYLERYVVRCAHPNQRSGLKLIDPRVQSAVAKVFNVHFRYLILRAPRRFKWVA